MTYNPSIINSGAPIKSSIPLVARKFGQGFGFSSQVNSDRSKDDEVLIDLSSNASNRSGAGEAKGSLNSKSSSSPLTQALDALGNIADRIGQLQAKYAKSPGGASSSEAISKELNSLAQEFKRITESRIFKPFGASSSDPQSNNLDIGSLEFLDSGLKSALNSGDDARISTLNDGLKGLESFSFENILTDKTIAGRVQDFIEAIKGALNPEGQNAKESSETDNKTDSVLVPLPQASIKTIGQAEGLTVSLLSYSNDDLIRAAASHVNIDSTNVLILTFNAPEPETEEEKLERERKSQLLELEQPASAAISRE